MKIRTKHVEKEAWLWDETKETFAVLCEAGMEWYGYSSHEVENYVRDLRIRTLEGPMDASKGDYIIKGLKGEFYPCKPDIFTKSYEVMTSSTEK